MRIRSQSGNLFLLLLLVVSGCTHSGSKGALTDAESGDLVFHISLSRQGEAISSATHSQYTHCGVVFADGSGEWHVLEAVQPVKNTPISDWLQRGLHSEFVLMRLKGSDSLLSPSVLNRMQEIGRSLLGKDYDLTFEWSDERQYCSELVWKIFQQGAGIELCPLRRLDSFDLTDPHVRQMLKERFGDSIPYDEPVVAPSDLMGSPLLDTIYHPSR